MIEERQMAIGLVGRKCGMTRVFTDAGDSVPVTVVELLPNRVTQVKTDERDGYRSVQVTYGARRPQLLSKAVAGHYAKAGVAPGRELIEFRLTGKDDADLQPGAKGGQVVVRPSVKAARLARRKSIAPSKVAAAKPAAGAGAKPAAAKAAAEKPAK
ncbi:MAG: 50S ribosomal protein L3 [Gammaproteobacteria bacterium]|nr:50S ribosomal protein L3 [Gammaproteobacteria bacterium]